MSQYMYRVAFCAAHYNDSLDGLFNPLQPTLSRSITGVSINRTGIVSFAGAASITIAPIDMAQALESDELYTIAAAGSMFTRLSSKPAIPRETPLDANELRREIRQYRLSRFEARRHGHDYDASNSIFQVMCGDVDVEDSMLFLLVNRVETASFAVYRGTFEQLALIWEGSQAEMAEQFNAATDKVKSDMDYVERYAAKWEELRKANIVELLPELARKDGVLLMTPEQLAKWQQQAKYRVCPTPAQVEAALG